MYEFVLEFEKDCEMDFELGRWYGPFALRYLWQSSLKRIAAIVTSKNDHVHHHQPQDKEKGREEMMELWESLGFVPNVAFVWFSLVLLLNLDWTEKWINLLEKILYDNNYYCYLPAMSLIFFRDIVIEIPFIWQPLVTIAFHTGHTIPTLYWRYIPLYMPPCLLPSIVALLFPDMDPLSICKSVPTTRLCSVFSLLYSCTY